MAALGEGVSRRARMVPPFRGGVVRAGVENSSGIRVGGDWCGIFRSGGGCARRVTGAHQARGKWREGRGLGGFAGAVVWLHCAV